jgi:hypothetical protein
MLGIKVAWAGREPPGDYGTKRGHRHGDLETAIGARNEGMSGNRQQRSPRVPPR